MIEYYKKVFPLTIGTILSLACVIFMVEAIRMFSLSYLDEWAPHLLVSVALGFIGFPIFFWGLERFGRQ